jgi:hypothetical protein
MSKSMYCATGTWPVFIPLSTHPRKVLRYEMKEFIKHVPFL